MRIVNCTWEFFNLDKRVVEISFDTDENVEMDYMQSFEQEYDYIVVKTQVCNPGLYRTLANLGYYFIENQISVTKTSFNISQSENSKKYFDLLASMSLIKVSSNVSLQKVLTSMTESMFITDRIYLDEVFGAQYSIRRYRNWTQSEYEKGTLLYEIQLINDKIGFILFKLKEGVMDVLLWGLYESYQKKGLGDVIPLAVYYIDMKIEKLKEFQTKVSSNNRGIIGKLNNLGFRFSHFEYVFVKHLN